MIRMTDEKFQFGISNLAPLLERYVKRSFMRQTCRDSERGIQAAKYRSEQYQFSDPYIYRQFS